MTFTDRDNRSMLGASALIGKSVVNLVGLDLGDIKEIVIDMRSGDVAYAVLAFGGFFGLREKLFAVPWQAMRFNPTNRCFVLDADKAHLKAAPGFNPHAWPDMADLAWANHVRTFYGTDPRRDGDLERDVPADGMVGGATRGAGASSGSAIGTRSGHD